MNVLSAESGFIEFSELIESASPIPGTHKYPFTRGAAAVIRGTAIYSFIGGAALPPFTSPVGENFFRDEVAEFPYSGLGGLI